MKLVDNPGLPENLPPTRDAVELRYGKPATKQIEDQKPTVKETENDKPAATVSPSEDVKGTSGESGGRESNGKKSNTTLLAIDKPSTAEPKPEKNKAEDTRIEKPPDMEAKDEKVNAPVPNTELTQSREPKKDELSDVDKELLKLHIAEYQMLSARATTGLVGQVQAASILLAALALFANAKDLNPFPKAATIWIGLLFAQMIGIFYSNGMIDTFKTILYLETAIRPAVQKLVGQKGTFWEYEQHLARQRGSGLIFHEITIPILAAASFALACIVRFKFTTNEPVNVVDGILIGLNLAATTVIVKWSHKSASIRRKWTDTENQAGKGIS